MTPLIQPIRGLRPASGRAAEVVAPPYDVLSTAEASSRAEGRPWSFLHISRPEIDLPADTDPYAPEVYARGAENLRRMLEAGVLVRDAKPCYYAYRLTMGRHTQTGLVAGASVAAYDSNRIRRHEFTRPAKEDDRVRQIEALNAQTGPVLLAHPDCAELDAILARISASAPEVDVTADDGVRHEIWTVADLPTIEAIGSHMEALPALYVADGHHRSAAASRVAAERPASGSARFFLSVIFPRQQMRILDYNRVVADLAGLDEAGFLERVGQAFSVETADGPVHPARPGEFGLHLPGRWLRLTVHPDRVPAGDPVGRLDVSLLQDNLIAPILGIEDPRRDARIDFVGGIRGLTELERRVAEGMAVAFSLHPTRMEDLMAVADAGHVMPPKSTWFEPKLADGLVSHVLD